MSRTFLAPLDAGFLMAESPETTMHVGGLAIFTPPPDAPPDFLPRIVAEFRAAGPVRTPWNRRLATPGLLKSPVQSWVTDDHIDLDYHVRSNALPGDGSERELGILVSRLHSSPLDLTRPPWEFHVIEGLAGGRFATYTKIHHSLVDGYSAMQVLLRSLTTDPEERDRPPFFCIGPVKRTKAEKQADRDGAALVADMGSALRGAVDLAKALARLELPSSTDLVASFDAPPTILNGRTGRSRRFATQQVSLSHLRAIAATVDGTINDVVLAVCGGGLRAFLAERGELPARSLVGFLPVSVRPKGDPGGGNAVGGMLASLGTDIADPRERLRAVHGSTSAAKAQMETMGSTAIMAYSAVLLAPYGLQMLRAMAGVHTPAPITLNVCISNVPGPRELRYFRGARMEANYPLSIPAHGMALNITCQSYVDTLCFGFIGCRDAVPHLQRLAVHTGTALAGLSEACGIPIP